MSERITKNYKLYLPKKNDRPEEYLAGFYNNFIKIDLELDTALEIQIADPYNLDINTNATVKRTITDLFARALEVHYASKLDNQNFESGIIAESKLNPHQVRAMDLYLSTSDKANGFITVGDTIIPLINSSLKDGNLISYTKTDFSGMNLNQLGVKENRNHSDLNLDLTLDVTKIDTTLDKHISNYYAKKWNDHSDNKSNPHNLKAFQIESESVGVQNGGDAITFELNKDTNTLKLLWAKVDKTGAAISSLPDEGRYHSMLTGVEGVIYNKLDNSNTRHVSGKKLYDYERHIQSYSENTSIIDGVPQSDFIINPHKTSFTQLFLTQQEKTSYSALKPIDIILKQINSESQNTLDFQINWLKLNKTGMTLQDFPFAGKTHALLTNILGADQSLLDTDKNKHVSNEQMNTIYNHMANKLNPHELNVFQLYGSVKSITAGNAIVEGLNHVGTTQKIDWRKLNFTGITIPDISTGLLHNDLTGRNIADWSLSDVTADKHVSNQQMKLLRDHSTSIGNPHSLRVKDILGNNYGTGADYSLITGKQAIIQEFNRSTDSTQILWNVISKTGASLQDLPFAGRSHSLLTSILEADPTSTNTAKDKHISNEQIKALYDHMNTVGGSNPHNVKAINLAGVGALANNGGKAIVEAVNNLALDSSMVWRKISFTNITLDDIGIQSNRKHNSLDISANTSNWLLSDTVFDKHVSNQQMNTIKQHLDSRENPHNVTANQIGKANIVDELNLLEPASKINKTTINFAGVSISDIGTRGHELLANILPADVTSDNKTQNRHVSDAQTKKWETHVDSLELNPHNTKANQIPINNTLFSKFDATNIEQALVEIDKYRNNMYTGVVPPLVQITETDTDVVMPSQKVLLFDNLLFEGKIKEYTVESTSFAKNNIMYFQRGKCVAIIVEWNPTLGKPVYTVRDNYQYINNSNAFIYALVFVDVTNRFFIQQLKCESSGLPMKLLTKEMEFTPYQRTSGLLLEDIPNETLDGSTRDFRVTSGIVWHGVTRFELSELDTRAEIKNSNGDLIPNPNYAKFYNFVHNTTNQVTMENPRNWDNLTILTPLDKVNNTDYHKGNLRMTMDDNHCNITWVYRDITTNNWYTVLGDGQFDMASPNFKDNIDKAQPPTVLPEIIMEHSILLGKIVTEKGGNIHSLYRAFDLIFTNTSVGSRMVSHHSELDGLQGGNSTERYHLSKTELDKLTYIEDLADVTDKENVLPAFNQILAEKAVGGITDIDLLLANSISNNGGIKKIGGLTDGVMTGSLFIESSTENQAHFSIGKLEEADKLVSQEFLSGNTKYRFAVQSNLLLGDVSKDEFLFSKFVDGIEDRIFETSKTEGFIIYRDIKTPQLKTQNIESDSGKFFGSVVGYGALTLGDNLNPAMQGEINLSSNSSNLYNQIKSNGDSLSLKSINSIYNFDGINANINIGSAIQLKTTEMSKILNGLIIGNYTGAETTLNVEGDASINGIVYSNGVNLGNSNTITQSLNKVALSSLDGFILNSLDISTAENITEFSVYGERLFGINKNSTNVIYSGTSQPEDIAIESLVLHYDKTVLKNKLMIETIAEDYSIVLTGESLGVNMANNGIHNLSNLNFNESNISLNAISKKIEYTSNYGHNFINSLQIDGWQVEII